MNAKRGLPSPCRVESTRVRKAKGGARACARDLREAVVAEELAARRPVHGKRPAGVRRGAELAPRVGVGPLDAAVPRVGVLDPAAAPRARRGDARQHHVGEPEPGRRVRPGPALRRVLAVRLDRGPQFVGVDAAELLRELVRALIVASYFVFVVGEGPGCRRRVRRGGDLGALIQDGRLPGNEPFDEDLVRETKLPKPCDVQEGTWFVLVFPKLVARARSYSISR